ncbi:MAG: hypothetical protein WC593_15320 [Methanoregula sp.]
MPGREKEHVQGLFYLGDHDPDFQAILREKIIDYTSSAEKSVE